MANPNILRTPITRKVQDLNGNAISGATANITVAPGTTIATIYDSETGVGTVSQPLVSNADGSFDGWLQIGLYEMEISSSFGTATSRYYVNHPQQSLLQGDSPDDENFQIRDDGDVEPRLSIDAGGTVEWGSGSVAEDTNLYRAGSAELKTDGAFVIGTNLNVGGDDLALAIKLNKEVFG
jgi:hypothetical protein